MHHHTDQGQHIQDHHHHLHRHHGDEMRQALSYINDKLPAGSNAHLGQRRKLQDGIDILFEVGLYIEYDTQLPNIIAGGGGEAGVVNYINRIVTGANSIYEVSNSFILPLLFYPTNKEIMLAIIY
jgi:hypothetical protein